MGPAAEGETRHAPERPFSAQSEEERRRRLGCYDRETYEDRRNRAFASLLATGLRFREVLEAPVSSVDRVTGVLTVRAKGTGSVPSGFRPGP